MGTLFGLVILGVWVYAIIDVLVTDRTSVRNLPKWAWVLIVVFLGWAAVGPVLWFFLGRPHRVYDTGDRPARARAPRPQAPRRVKPTRAERAEEEAEIRARIAERDRLLAQWAEEDRLRGRVDAPSPEDRP